MNASREANTQSWSQTGAQVPHTWRRRTCRCRWVGSGLRLGLLNACLFGVGQFPLRADTGYADSEAFVLDTVGAVTQASGMGYSDSALFSLNTVSQTVNLGGAGYSDTATLTLNTVSQTVNLGGVGYADTTLFTLDTRAFMGPFLVGGIGNSDLFTVDTRGEAAVVSGSVFDGETGLGLANATVNLAGLNTSSGGQGQYAFSSVPAGTYSLTVSRAGYSTYNATLAVPGGATVRRDVSLSPATAGFRVTGITCLYPGFQHFLDGPIFPLTFTATVDWAGHPPGRVEFLTPKEVRPVTTSGTTAACLFNMGSAFGPNGKLRAVAVSSDGTRSAEKLASLIVMPPPLGVLGGTALFPSHNLSGSGFKYKSSVGFNMSFFDKAIGDGALPENIPLFGKNAVALKFIPEMTCEVGSDGVATFDLAWKDATLAGSFKKERESQNDLRTIADKITEALNAKRIDEGLLPKTTMVGTEFHWFPIAGGQFQFNKETGDWAPKGFDAGLAGEFSLEKSWPFVLMAGPVPVPMYAKAGVEVTAEAQFQVVQLEPVACNGLITLEPYVRGSLGAGVDQILAVEGWIGGGMQIDLQYPALPTFDVSLYLNGGVTVYALLWQWENELLHWDYPQSSSAAPMLARPAAGGENGPRMSPRDYLGKPDYAKFHGNGKKKGWSKNGKMPPLSPLSSPLQTTIFPHSEPDCWSAGTNFHLVWLYDDPSRETNNRTLTVFSRYNGTDWTDPIAVANDGTADFHPQVLTFADGWSVAAWENERVVLPNGVTFESMTTNMEVAAAWWNPQTASWLPARNFTTNSFLDRSPKLAGINRSNVLMVWVANAASQITGEAAHPNELLYSRWNGATWSAAQAFLTVANPLVKYDLVYDGTNGNVVMSVDTSNTQTNVAARELFRVTYLAGNWGAAERLTTDALPDDNPQLALSPNGDVVMVWLRENELSSVVNFAMSGRQPVRTNIYCSNLGDAKLTQSSDRKLALLWAEPSNFSSDIHGVFYDPIFKLWGKPKQFTTDQETERSLTTGFWGTERLVAVYNRCMIGPTNSGANTDLYVLEYGLGDDLCLKWLRSDPLNPGPGETTTLTTRVANQGDRALTNVPVAFYQGEPGAGGVEFGRMTVAGPLAPGDETEVTCAWTVPATTQPITVYALGDPDLILGEVIRSNNVLGLDISQSDLAVQSVTWSLIASNKISIVARIGNVGGISNQTTTVEFRLGSPTGTNLFSTGLTNLGPGEAMDISFLWNLAGLGDNLDIYVVIDGVAALSDYDRQNNTWRITVQPATARANLWMGPVLRLPGGEFQITITSEAGRYIYLETSSDLETWQSWTSVFSTNTTSTVIDGTATNAEQRFYRAVVR